jgi:dienelactone hydrolase
MMRRISLLVKLSLLSAALFPLAVRADIEKKPIGYTDGDTKLEGILVQETSTDADKRPSVLICHQWMGLTDYEEMRAEMLAKLGYVVFALDIYGKGVRPADRGEAAQLAGKYKGDRDLLRSRAKAGLNALLGQPNVDPAKVAVIGYCFGGTTALELARSGAEVAGVVSFHGGLSTPDPKDAEQIQAKILALHGAVDPHVPIEEVLAFGKEMEEADVDWQFVSYGGAVHAFTQKHAGDDPSTGVAYDEKADQRSWQAMRSFFDEVFEQ